MLPIFGFRLTSTSVLDKFKKFVSGRLDPENTLDIIQDRPTILQLTKDPLVRLQRIQLPDEKIVQVEPITPTESLSHKG
jgi:hypothetical protein